jgi:hypothetical protein
MGQSEQCLPARVKAPPAGSALVAVTADEAGEMV